MYELYKHCTNIYEPNYIYEMNRGWLRPNVASAPWKVFFAMWIYLVHGGCPKFCLLETAILSQKKNYFSQTFAILTKNFRGALCWIVSGNFFVRKQKLDKGHLRVWATIKTHSVAAAHSRVAFCFNGGPCSPSPASSDTPTPKLRAHLLPASLQTRHNKSTV